jgi:hypothetical protein
MIHKKSCFGRTFVQDTQASEPDGKSWSDDKFYENLQAKMISKPPEPVWQPQWTKPVIEKLAWGLDTYAINPGTGLPMINSAFDVSGNVYGYSDSNS